MTSRKLSKAELRSCIRFRSRELIFKRRSVNSSPIVLFSFVGDDEVRRRRRFVVVVVVVDEDDDGISVVDGVGDE